MPKLQEKKDLEENIISQLLQSSSQGKRSISQNRLCLLFTSHLILCQNQNLHPIHHDLLVLCFYKGRQLSEVLQYISQTWSAANHSLEDEAHHEELVDLTIHQIKLAIANCIVLVRG